MTARRGVAVEVWADWSLLPSPARVGTLHVATARGRDTFSFEYDAAWLASGRAPALDPALELVRGRQFAAADRTTFGVFLDSCPDRWGRMLMQRRETQLARSARRAERRLGEVDFLLGVFDGHRLGGLRYRIGDGPFLDDNAALASPPWTSLAELEQASLALERDGAERSRHYSAWLGLLIAPGRSLGGARPKASVVDGDGRLWMAKFPSAHDADDIGAWESVVHALAVRAKIQTAEATRRRFGGRHHTFLSRRFDRAADGRRIHFASAMTMLDRVDGAASEGASYVDLARVVVQRGAHPARDLEELWRRIAFFACVSNVDDHLRNHGFVLEAAGWALAPAYDMNPVATAGGLALNISETDNAQDLELVRDVAGQFRVKRARATQILAEVVAAARGWRAEAKRLKLARAAIDRMSGAFRVADDARP
nr:type II toxin-antitoxin system HipA family toxin [Kofleriaceae bacterium]